MESETVIFFSFTLLHVGRMEEEKIREITQFRTFAVVDVGQNCELLSSKRKKKKETQGNCEDGVNKFSSPF
jgi:hypothetical protein